MAIFGVYKRAEFRPPLPKGVAAAAGARLRTRQWRGDGSVAALDRSPPPGTARPPSRLPQRSAMLASGGSAAAAQDAGSGKRKSPDGYRASEQRCEVPPGLVLALLGGGSATPF